MARARREFNPGEQIGHLTVLRAVGAEGWWCRCDCGNETEIPRNKLSKAKTGTKSCGCRARPWVVEWTPELDRLIADSRAAGLTNTVIATGLTERLGKPVTKNMVLGRGYRRHLTPPRPRPKKEPRPSRLPLPGGCFYPKGDPRDPDFHYCGERVQQGRDYCPVHHALTHLKPNDEKKPRELSVDVHAL